MKTLVQIFDYENGDKISEYETTCVPRVGEDVSLYGSLYSVKTVMHCWKMPNPMLDGGDSVQIEVEIWANT